MLFSVFLFGCTKQEVWEPTEALKQLEISQQKKQELPSHLELKGEPLLTKLNEKGEVYSDPNRIMLNDTPNDIALDKSLTN